jgi:hypothetical protein
MPIFEIEIKYNNNNNPMITCFLSNFLFFGALVLRVDCVCREKLSEEEKIASSAT